MYRVNAVFLGEQSFTDKQSRCSGKKEWVDKGRRLAAISRLSPNVVIRHVFSCAPPLGLSTYPGFVRVCVTMTGYEPPDEHCRIQRQVLGCISLCRIGLQAPARDERLLTRSVTLVYHQACVTDLG